jgi:hypothetical protein
MSIEIEKGTIGVNEYASASASEDASAGILFASALSMQADARALQADARALLMLCSCIRATLAWCVVLATLSDLMRYFDVHLLYSCRIRTYGSF